MIDLRTLPYTNHGKPLQKPLKIDTQAVLDFFGIYTNQNYLPSYRILRLVLGSKYSQILQHLIDHQIISVSDDRYFFYTNRYGEKKGTRLKRKVKYLLPTQNIDITTNSYHRKLQELYQANRITDKKDLLIINAIQSTLERSTLNGQKLDLNYLKKIKDRLYSDYSTLGSETRSQILIDNQKTISIDLTATVLQLLSQTNFGYGFDQKLYFDFMQSTDFWSDQAIILKIPRQEVKELWSKVLFGDWYCIDTRLTSQYPLFFNNVKKFKNKFGYKEMSRFFFHLEWVEMSDIMMNLAINKIDFLPIHDCLIVKVSDCELVSNLFENKNLKFKIN